MKTQAQITDKKVLITKGDSIGVVIAVLFILVGLGYMFWLSIEDAMPALLP